MNDPRQPTQISIEDAVAWQREYADMKRQAAELQAKCDALSRKIEAAKILFPNLESHTPQVVKAMGAEPQRLATWKDLVLYALAQAGGGRTQAQILKAAKDTALADRARKSPNGLYIVVKKLEGRGEVIRDGQHFYLPEVWEKIQRGEIEDDREEVTLNAGSAQQVVLALMRDGRTRTPREIEDALRVNPKTSKQTQNPGYIYNLLCRMVRNDRITRVSDGNYVIRKENEPPAYADGSDAGGAGTPLFENVTRFPGAR